MNQVTGDMWTEPVKQKNREEAAVVEEKFSPAGWCEAQEVPAGVAELTREIEDLERSMDAATGIPAAALWSVESLTKELRAAETERDNAYHDVAGLREDLHATREELARTCKLLGIEHTALDAALLDLERTHAKRVHALEALYEAEELVKLKERAYQIASGDVESVRHSYEDLSEYTNALQASFDRLKTLLRDKAVRFSRIFLGVCATGMGLFILWLALWGQTDPAGCAIGTVILYVGAWILATELERRAR